MGSYLRIGHTYDALSEYKISNEYYNKVLRLDSYNAESYIKLGRNNFRLGNLKAAELYLKKSLQVSLNNKRSLHFLAMVLADQNQISKAVRMFEISLAVDPNYKYAHLNFAIFLSRLKLFRKAIYHFKEASRLGVDKEKIKELAQKFGLKLTINPKFKPIYLKS